MHQRCGFSLLISLTCGGLLWSHRGYALLPPCPISAPHEDRTLSQYRTQDMPYLTTAHRKARAAYAVPRHRGLAG
eukprot:743051-Rhodomonas_salina.3